MIASGTRVGTQRIAVALISDQSLTREALAQLIAGDDELETLGTAEPSDAEPFLNDSGLRVLLVNLSLAGEGGAPGRELPSGRLSCHVHGRGK